MCHQISVSSYRLPRKTFFKTILSPIYCLRFSNGASIPTIIESMHLIVGSSSSIPSHHSQNYRLFKGVGFHIMCPKYTFVPSLLCLKWQFWINCHFLAYLWYPQESSLTPKFKTINNHVILLLQNLTFDSMQQCISILVTFKMYGLQCSECPSYSVQEYTKKMAPKDELQRE